MKPIILIAVLVLGMLLYLRYLINNALTRKGKARVALISLSTVSLLSFVIGSSIWYILPSRSEVTAEDFRSICEANGFEVMDGRQGDTIEHALNSQKGVVNIYFKIYSSAKDATTAIAEDWSDAGALINVHWGERERFGVRKWGEQYQYIRTGRTVMVCVYNVVDSSFGDRWALNRLLGKLLSSYKTYFQ